MAEAQKKKDQPQSQGGGAIVEIDTSPNAGAATEKPVPPRPDKAKKGKKAPPPDQAQGQPASNPGELDQLLEADKPDAGPKTIVFGTEYYGDEPRTKEQEKDNESTPSGAEKKSRSMRVAEGGPTYLPEEKPDAWKRQSFKPLAAGGDPWKGHRAEIMLGLNIPQPDTTHAWGGVGPGFWLALGYHYRLNQYLGLGLVFDLDVVTNRGVRSFGLEHEASGKFMAYTRKFKASDYTLVGGRPVLRLFYPISLAEPFGLDFFGETGFGMAWSSYGGHLEHDETDFNLQSTRNPHREYDIEGSHFGPYATFGAGADLYFMKQVGVGLCFRWAFPLSTSEPGDSKYTEPINPSTGKSHTWVYSPIGKYTSDGLEHEQLKRDEHDRVIRGLGALSLPAIGVHAIMRF